MPRRVEGLGWPRFIPRDMDGWASSEASSAAGGAEPLPAWTASAGGTAASVPHTDDVGAATPPASPAADPPSTGGGTVMATLYGGFGFRRGVVRSRRCRAAACLDGLGRKDSRAGTTDRWCGRCCPSG